MYVSLSEYFKYTTLHTLFISYLLYPTYVPYPTYLCFFLYPSLIYRLHYLNTLPYICKVSEYFQYLNILP
jgi:hypothetical protein